TLLVPCQRSTRRAMVSAITECWLPRHRLSTNHKTNAALTGPSSNKFAYNKLTGSLLLLKKAMGDEKPTTAHTTKPMVSSKRQEAIQRCCTASICCCCATK